MAVDAIEISDEEYLILAKSQDSFIFINSSEICEFEEYKNQFKLFANRLTTEKIPKSEVDLTCELECEHSNLSELSFLELFDLYDKLCRLGNTAENLKEKISGKMGLKINSYKYEGLIDTYFNFSSLPDVLTKIRTQDYYSDAVNYLIDEFKIYSVIRAYTSLNIYDLIFEHTKLVPVARGYVKTHPLMQMGISYLQIKNRIEPAIAYIKKLKFDIMLIELCGIARDWEYYNPFQNERIVLNESRYVFDLNKRMEFDHGFFENLGINTENFVSELALLEKYRYSFIVDEILEMSGFAMEYMLSEKDIALKYTKLLYGDIGFVKYLISILDEA